MKLDSDEITSPLSVAKTEALQFFFLLSHFKEYNDS